MAYQPEPVPAELSPAYIGRELRRVADEIARLRRESLPATHDVALRVPADFDTLQQAIDYASTLRVRHRAVIVVLIEAGHTVTQGTNVVYGDWSHIIVRAEDAVVPCDLSGADTDFLFGAINGAFHPQIDARFDLQGTGNGAYARRSGVIYFRPSSGAINASGWGAYAYRGGVINASRKHTEVADSPVHFSGAGNYAARARRGGIFNGVASILSGAGSSAIQLNYGGIAHINAADVSGAGNDHIVCQGGSLCFAAPLTVSDGPLRTSITPNVVGREGLIIADT